MKNELAIESHILFVKKKQLLLTTVWQKWQFSASQTHWWLIKVWFSALKFVVKIATFAKPLNVISHYHTQTTLKK
jgi:hypothetical protein